LRGATPFSLDLNVASLLGPDFRRFDAALRSALRGTIMVALRPPDILADPAPFLFARDFVRARGYRQALAGIDAARLALFPLAALGLDLLLLRWSPALADETPIFPDPARIVLCSTDDAAALAWGQGRGPNSMKAGKSGKAGKPGKACMSRRPAGRAGDFIKACPWRNGPGSLIPPPWM
jgi:hypothetical protein